MNRTTIPAKTLLLQFPKSIRKVSQIKGNIF